VNGGGAPLADEALAARPVVRPTAAMKRASLLVTLCYLALTGCGETSPRKVPDVTGERLDVAEDVLDDAGLPYDVDGGVVIIRSHWRVVRQIPAAGTRARRVHVVVVHCEEDDWDD
jgi:hypothetical protein